MHQQARHGTPTQQYWLKSPSVVVLDDVPTSKHQFANEQLWLELLRTVMCMFAAVSSNAGWQCGSLKKHRGSRYNLIIWSQLNYLVFQSINVILQTNTSCNNTA